MDLLRRNLWNGRYIFGGFVAINLIGNNRIVNHMVHTEVFGYDGNGGDMLKIITNLTDEEIAGLKFQRRMHWHWRGMSKFSQNGNEKILDQELADRGIDLPKEPYIEYVKRPPHDKYL